MQQISTKSSQYSYKHAFHDTCSQVPPAKWNKNDVKDIL